MPQIPILSGVYTDQVADFRTHLPRNLVPVPKEQGISKGYLRPAEGVEQLGTGPGLDRGAINWNDALYRVMGTKLVTVSKAGAVTVLGDVGAGSQVTMDYSFDRLGIASGGKLWYWNGTTLSQVTDPDIRTVIDMKWIAGYFFCTDGVYLITTDLNNPASVQVLNYGSAEADPDPIKAVDELRNEAYAFGRYTIEVFQNVGGTGFPFQRIEGAQVGKGVIGTHSYCGIGNTFVFLGSGRGEAPAVYKMLPGDVQKISSREVDSILLGYTEAELALSVMECRVQRNHQQIYLHLPDQCLVFDSMASDSVQEPVWYTADSGLMTPATYRARNMVWCYDQWNCADPTSTKLGRLSDSVSTHYGDVIGWDFGTMVVYNEGRGAIFKELELIGLPGRVALGVNPTIWTSHSFDGQKWSEERPISAGKAGQTLKRLAWRRLGKMRNYRMQRFRGTSDAYLSFARLEADLEPLNG